MFKQEPELTPGEVRAIRESLGLSQLQAGKLLGGGPRAFAKYEAGTIRPAASLVRLLRLLEENPAELRRISGNASVPALVATPRPFEVEGAHISALDTATLASLLRRLLHAEAQSNNLPEDGIHVASVTTAPDGGEDGRIRWYEGPGRTSFLPGRHCQFQLKSGDITPSKAGREVVSKSGGVKPMIREGLAGGGFYIMLCTKAYPQAAIDRRVSQMQSRIRDSELSIIDKQVTFRDADQLAEWVNQHPAVATWVLERTQPGLVGPFRSWSNWAGRGEHAACPFVEDERLHLFQPRLCDAVRQPGGVARVIGLSGIGASRLTLEALKPTDADERRLSDIVVYAVESEAGALAIKTTVQNLADSGKRSIVVVDACSDGTVGYLVNATRHTRSRLSLVTIEDGNPDKYPDDHLNCVVVKVREAADTVIRALVRKELPQFTSQDRDRLVRFSSGFPKIARLVSAARAQGGPLAHALGDQSVERLVLGQGTHNQDFRLKVCKILSVFWAVGILGSDRRIRDEVAALGCGLASDELYAATQQLTERGIVKARGRNAVVRPRPLALKLAELQWKEWTHERWDELLAGETSSELKVAAARQLALLNTTDTAKDVVRHVTRRGGKLWGWDRITQPGHLEILSALAEISPSAVIQVIWTATDGLNLAEARGSNLRSLIRTVTKIAFDAATFEEGANVLLRLSSKKNEEWADSATTQFAELFPVILGNTEAGPAARLRVLKSAATSESVTQRLVAVEALKKGCKTNSFHRYTGPEYQGSRPPLQSWHPTSKDEAQRYVARCATLLAELAQRNDETGSVARSGLGRRLRSLISFGLIDTVEQALSDLGPPRGGSWPEAEHSLRVFLTYDTSSSDQLTVDRVRALLDEFEANRSDRDRLSAIVSEMPWDYLGKDAKDFEKRDRLQRQAVCEYASCLVAQPERLTGHLPRLSQGTQRMTRVFGEAIAQFADKPLEWLAPIKAAAIQAPDDKRDHSLLVGYIVGIVERAPDVVDEFKVQAAQSRELASALPRICWWLGIRSSDIRLVLYSMERGCLPAAALLQWTVGNKLVTVPVKALAPLFDYLLDHGAGSYLVGLQLISALTYGNGRNMDQLRPQVLKAARNLSEWPPRHVGHEEYCFERIMNSLLSKGRSEPAACELALELAKGLKTAVMLDYESLIRPLLPTLLRDFPEVTWGIIGSEIVSDPKFAWRFEFLVRRRSGASRRERQVITHLSEPVLFAWCHANPDGAPKFLAKVAPIFVENDDGEKVSLHPLIRRTIDEFGMNRDVMEAISSNFLTFSWVGSMKPHLEKCQPLIRGLCSHHHLNVRIWAKQFAREIEKMIGEAEEDRAEFESGLDL